MKARSSSNVGKIVAGSLGVLLLLIVFVVLGQLVGGLIFGLMEKLPSESAPVIAMRLWHYWPVYADVKKVRNALSVATFVAGVIGVGPFVILIAVVASSKFKRRELHGSARFANLRQIRKSGLVADDHE
jgi:hypothetical protein